jgi:tRNA nucleotidyltransferase (CCA-adding enzyme)
MCQKNFYIIPSLEQAIIENKERLNIISKERINVELDKIVMSNYVNRLNDSCAKEIMKIIIPELNDMMNCFETEPWHWNESIYEHTIRTIENCPKIIYLRRAALFHDIGKAKCRTVDEKGIAHIYGHDIIGATMAENIMKGLKYSNDDIKVVSKLIANHMKPHLYNSKWGDKAIRKFIVEMGDLMDVLLLLADADTINSSEKEFQCGEGVVKHNELRNRIKELKKDKIHYKPIINGDRLQIILNKGSGKWIREIMDFQMNILYKNPNITEKEMENKIIQHF